MRDSNVFQLIGTANFNMFQLVEALREEIAFYSEKIKLDELAYKEAYEKHSNRQTSYHEAKSINTRFMELEEKQQKLANLQEQSEVYAQKQRQLEEAERASTIETVEVYYKDLQSELNSKLELLETAKKGIIDTEGTFKKITTAYVKEDAKKEERDKSVEVLIQLNALIPLFEDLEKKKFEMQELERLTVELNSKVKVINDQFIHEKETCALQKEQIEKLEQLVEPLDQHVQQLSVLEANYKVLQEYVKHEKQLKAYKFTRVGTKKTI